MIKKTKRILDLERRERAVYRKERKLIAIESSLNQDRVALNEYREQLSTFFKKAQNINNYVKRLKKKTKIPKKGAQFDYNNGLYIFGSLILGNILIGVTTTRFVKNPQILIGVWSLFNLICIFVYTSFTQLIMRKHNKYVIKKGDYKIKGIDYDIKK